MDTIDTDLNSGAPAHFRGFTSKSLYRAIFDSDSPEQFVRTLPSQSVYTLLKQRGLQSATDLLEITPISIIRVCLDFDLWDKDKFNEENFWEWLSLTDDLDPLKFTQTLLKATDLKLISLLIGRYVQVQIFDESTDNPPGPGFYTPDKGNTWINVAIEDGTRHFLFSRLLALIFETSAELFYQLISIPGVSTESVLEEESYQDKSKRLCAEGVPEFEQTEELNASLLPADAKQILLRGEKRRPISDIPPIEPILYDVFSTTQPLNSVLSSVKDREECEAELTLILNASVQFFSIPFYEYDAVLAQVERIKGAINIGLEKASANTSLSPFECYEILGLQKLYRLGLFELRQLRNIALKILDGKIAAQKDDAAMFSVIAHAREIFPELPAFVNSDGSFNSEGGSLTPGARPFVHTKEVEFIKSKLSELS